ncbi:MAG: glycosyltransferase family 4 protein [Roseiflexus sp.]|nr:glycosyltransferase family 4 protein [Roseiflexus sp.]MCS7290343.1 glycosyltransferase family 4 protein [Roseiflexus sp.]MDW8146097.1 glycosyltransferase family 4 protein [Roseiflexaceae bacterium]MDW8231241.1 glycosyltransferase family 4 protein [Roseiflexaceae bacterium]
MRIVMLAPFGIRPKGTLAARMLPLAQALTRRGHKVVIVAPPVHNPEDAATCMVYGSVPVIHTAAPSLPGAAGVAQQTLALLRETLRQSPDILHLFKPKGYSGLAALLMRTVRPATPLVVDTDDWEGPGGWNDLLPYPPLAKRLFAWQERDLPRRADAVTVASRALETLMWSLGIPSNRVFYLPNGVEPVALNGQPSTFHPRSAASNLLLYTRFWELDVREIVAALVGITIRRSDARLIVAGKGERGEEHMLLRLAERAGLAHAVEYRGWLASEQIPATLASADVALMPMRDTLINRARGLAKLLELMGAGLPIVATRVGQAAEYLEHGVSGWLIPPGNAGALAESAILLLSDADLRRRLSIGARQAALRYAWDALAPIVEQAYLGVRS